MEIIRKILAGVKSYVARTKQAFTRVESIAHSFIVAAVGGGIDSLWSEYHSAGKLAFDAAHLVEMKAHFVRGAVIAILFWLKTAPEIKKSIDAQAAQPTAPAEPAR